MTKRVYLLSTARTFSMEDIRDSYDKALQLNVIRQGSENVPLVSIEAFGRTESKTMQAPGDDDPDPEDEGCY